MKFTQPITPHLWFHKDARMAAEFYVAVFGGDSRLTSARTLENTPSGTVEIVSFALHGQAFMAISAGPLFTFNESISFMINCETQEEIDYYWEKLSAVPEAEQCGWLKDKFGLSWQIVPSAMGEMMQRGDAAQVARLTAAFLKMKKFDLAALQRAFAGS